MLIVDNFFDEDFLEEVRDVALNNIPYFSHQELDDQKWIVGWKGWRTNASILTKEPAHILVDQMCHEKLVEYFGDEKLTTATYFHYSLESTGQEEDFIKTKWHQDETKYAGIVYLTPNPPEPEKTGTMVLIDDEIVSVDNVYNRLVCYSGELQHAPGKCFGDNIENGRLTITIFADPNPMAAVHTMPESTKEMAKLPGVDTSKDIMSRNLKFHKKAV
jgi:hypothetical protein